MPKFLDRPSWYESNGTQVYGVGISASSHVEGEIPVYRAAAGTFTAVTPLLNGTTLTNMSSWYAPLTNGTWGQILIGHTGYGRPVWLDPGESGKFLRTNGALSGSPSWDYPIKTYSTVGSTVNEQAMSQNGMIGNKYVSFLGNPDYNLKVGTATIGKFVIYFKFGAGKAFYMYATSNGTIAFEGPLSSSPTFTMTQSGSQIYINSFGFD